MTDIENQTISEAQAAKDRLNKSRIPFPLAGDEAFLQFNMLSLVNLEKAADRIVPDWMIREFSSFGIIEKLLLDGNAVMVRAVLDAGLKRLGDNGKPQPMAEIDLDEVEWPVSAVVEAALQVVCYCYTGSTYSEMLEKMTAAHEAEEAEREKLRSAG